MILIVDANVFISALISKGKTLRVLAINSVTETFELLAPGFYCNKKMKKMKNKFFQCLNFFCRRLSTR